MRFDTLDSTRADQLDFVPRKRRGRVFRVIFAFTLTITLIFMLAFAPPLSGFAIYTPLVAIVLMAFLCLYVVYHEQITLDLVMSTEYQNMLYAQALSLGSSFCMIVRREGTIVYASDGMNSIFPQFDYSRAKALEGVFEQGLVRKIDRERIMGAIHSSTPDRLIFPIINQYQDKKDYIITVEPMPRPSGFSLIRGREYLGQRTGIQLMPDALRSTSVDKIDHLLATTDSAHYTTDAFGRFEYVNPACERLFGYAPNEIVESKLGFHNLVFSLGEQTVTEEYSLADYVGSVVILCKPDGRRSYILRQQVVKDSAGKIIGATGTFIPA